MSLWVKICGNTSLQDAQLAIDAGADAVGFVFAPSPRRVTAAEVGAISAQLPVSIEKIGVFVDATFNEIRNTVRTARLTGVQLHFEAEADLPAKLRGEFGTALRVLRVAHFEAGAASDFVQRLAVYSSDPHVSGVLVDSRTAVAVGGTGVAFDWNAARKALVDDVGNLRLIAAGGLTPANVAEAIATLRPWGVDVVSGVEAAPGRKDPAKVRQFIANARTAEPKPSNFR
jgi:phosphoribosylanthranilate isomerase